jgi:hypothetical protein
MSSGMTVHSGTNVYLAFKHDLDDFKVEVCLVV